MARVRKSARLKRRKKQELELDINSLLDILVILLVFLLQNYSASELEISLPKNMKIPDSKSREYGAFAPTVKVTKDGAIYLEKEEIVPNLKNAIDTEGKIAVLYNRLVKIRKEREAKNIALRGRKPAGEDEREGLTVNLVLDKNLDYGAIKKVMHTTGTAGYGKFKFLVQSEEP